ncbi:MAG: MFS transporter [Deltaproteobacteria bacterium]|nr:MFS transporter [Deltaproteobacteria bacterium]
MFRGWRIVGVSALAQGVSVGSTFYVYGTFLKPLAAEFDASRLAVTLGLTLLTVVQGLVAPLIGRAFDGGSPRTLMLTGVACHALGLALLSQITAFWQAGLLFVLPIAMGAHLFGPLATSTVVNRWFVRRRGQALGIASLGSSLGGAAFPAIAAALIAAFDWRGAFGAMGLGILLLMLPIAWILVGKPEDVGETPDGDPGPGADATAEMGTPNANGALTSVDAELAAAAAVTTRSLLRDRSFWAISIAIGFGYCPVSVLLAHLVPYATDAGISASRAAVVMTCYALSGAFGRVFLGWLCDRIDPRAVVWLDYAWFGLAWIGLLSPPSFGTLLFTGIAAGIAVGGITPVWAALTGAVYGRMAFGRAMGLMNFVMLPFSVIGAPIAARLFDVTGSYRLAFASFFVCFVLGAVAIAFLRPPARALRAA